MTKREITRTVWELWDDFDEPLLAFLERLAALVATAPDADKGSLFFHFHRYHGYDGDCDELALRVEVRRMETDAEHEARLDGEAVLRLEKNKAWLAKKADVEKWARADELETLIRLMQKYNIRPEKLPEPEPTNG